jgi:uncharacterized protein (DUF58 family)
VSSPGGSLLPAELLASLGSLELAARGATAGLGVGRHRALRAGSGDVFSEHRSYRPGDDLRHLDWKVLARTDRLYLRRFHAPSELGLLLLVDSSASMAFPRGGAEPSRLRYAAILAAALAFLAVRGGDRVGLFLPGVPPGPLGGGRRHLARLVARLESAEAGGPGFQVPPLETGLARLGRRNRILLVSDLLSGEEALLTALGRAAAAGHTVEVIHLLADREFQEMPGGGAEFVDAEEGGSLLADPRGDRQGVLGALAAFHARVSTLAAGQGVRLVRADTRSPPGLVLRHLLRSGAGGVVPGGIAP